MCGEENLSLLILTLHREIPPRVRRRVINIRGRSRVHGNTSACAEKSGVETFSEMGARKYLRVCGEEKVVLPIAGVQPEIPPRVRRRDIQPVDLAV